MDDFDEASLGQPTRVVNHLVNPDVLGELGQRGAEDEDVVTEVGVLGQQIDDVSTLVLYLHLLIELRHDSLLRVADSQFRHRLLAEPLVTVGSARNRSSPEPEHINRHTHSIAQCRIARATGCGAVGKLATRGEPGW